MHWCSAAAIVATASIGQVGLEWQVAGFGDFSSRPGETDMLMRNGTTGAFEVYNIGDNAITSAASMGAVGLAWTVAGFGDFSSNSGETDMLLRNSNSGAFEAPPWVRSDWSGRLPASAISAVIPMKPTC